MRGSTSIEILSDEDQESLRVACKVLPVCPMLQQCCLFSIFIARVSFQYGREVLDVAAGAVAVGVTTEEIDKLVHEVTFCAHENLRFFHL